MQFKKCLAVSLESCPGAVVMLGGKLEKKEYIEHFRWV